MKLKNEMIKSIYSIQKVFTLNIPCTIASKDCLMNPCVVAMYKTYCKNPPGPE